MTEEFDRLRRQVKAWYREEAARVAAAHAAAGTPDQVDFDELVRRSQVLLACEMVELIEDDQGVRLSPGSPDHVQLARVAQAMRARGAEVPDSIRKALGED